MHAIVYHKKHWMFTFNIDYLLFYCAYPVCPLCRRRRRRCCCCCCQSCVIGLGINRIRYFVFVLQFTNNTHTLSAHTTVGCTLTLRCKYACDASVMHKRTNKLVPIMRAGETCTKCEVYIQSISQRQQQQQFNEYGKPNQKKCRMNKHTEWHNRIENSVRNRLAVQCTRERNVRCEGDETRVQCMGDDWLYEFCNSEIYCRNKF